MTQKFFRCELCGNLVGMIHDSGAPMTCCGQHMTELTANTVDAAAEKHVPVAARQGGSITVTVGAVEHPMAPEHYIEWIYIQTTQGGQRKALQPGDALAASFLLADGDAVQAVYAYCNVHGLWKQDL